MITLVINIKQLFGTAESNVPLRREALATLASVENAWILVEDGYIAGYGHMLELETQVQVLPPVVIDASDQFVFPCWCDSHTHLVFAKSREEEFVYKLKGKTYAEIAAMGGGILNSARVLQDTTEDELFDQAMVRLTEIARLGTGAVEIKSGYGLTLESELKMLRVIRRLKESSPMTIRSTFLGAHTYPLAYRDNHQGYLEQLIQEMLPAIANEGLADFIDVFCEEGFFSPEEMKMLCEAGRKYGLRPKLHVNQLNSIGGIPAAVSEDALSVDHLETMTPADIESLAASNTIGTLLPTAAFFLRMPYQPARDLVEAGCAIALASDYNPGSSPSGNMNFVAALSCIQMKLLPEEVINAATINGAFAMGVEKEAGSITIGKNANLIFTRPVPSLAYLAYSFGSNLVDKVMIKGQFV